MTLLAETSLEYHLTWSIEATRDKYKHSYGHRTP